MALMHGRPKSTASISYLAREWLRCEVGRQVSNSRSWKEDASVGPSKRIVQVKVQKVPQVLATTTMSAPKNPHCPHSGSLKHCEAETLNRRENKWLLSESDWLCETQADRLILSINFHQ